MTPLKTMQGVSFPTQAGRLKEPGEFLGSRVCPMIVVLGRKPARCDLSGVVLPAIQPVIDLPSVKQILF